MGQKLETAPQRAKDDTRKWLLNSFIAWILAPIITLGGGVLSALFLAIKAIPVSQAIYGAIGALSALALFILIVYLVHLIIAPYRQRNEAREYVDTLEKEREPQLTVEKVVEGKYGNTSGESWGLVVHNQGTDRADDCQAQLLQLEFADPAIGQTLHAWPINQPLQWENIPEYSAISTSIPGSSSVILQIANRDGMREHYIPKKHALHLSFARSEDFREEHYLPVSTYAGGNDYLIIISVSSRNRLPLYVVCYIVNRRYGSQMILVEVVTEKQPTIDECRQMLIEHKAEIEKQLASGLYHGISMGSHGC